MSAFASPPTAATNLVRVAYFDEAGISNPGQEPIMTVAGVIVHGDRQWQPVESYLEELADRYVGKSRASDFAFHAYELFNGAKRFNKGDWPLATRLAILDDLANIPEKFNLPIFHCSVDRIYAANYLGEQCGSDSLERTVHSHAYFFCCFQIETYLEECANSEVALLIAEDRVQVRRMIKLSHEIFRGRRPDTISLVNEALRGGDYLAFGSVVPFTHIIESVQFAQKTESSLLQIADICAFAIKRWIMGKPHAARLFKPLRKQLILRNMPIGLGPSVQSVSLEV